MNKVILVGKIARINKCENITLTTICVHERGHYEYVPVKIFNNEFFNRYFFPDKWITIEGHIKINEYKGTYQTEIIADNISFTGEANDADREIQRIYKEHDEEMKKYPPKEDNPFFQESIESASN